MDPRNPYEPGVAPVHMGVGLDGSLSPVPVDLSAILQRSWELLTANVGLVAGAILLPMVVTLPFVMVLGGLGVAMDSVDDETLQALLAVMLGGTYLVMIPIILIPFLGSLRIFTSLARGAPASLSMLAGEIRRLPAALASFLVMGLVVSIGYAMCIVPGIVLAFALQFAPYVMIDQGRGPIESLTDSWAIAYPHLLQILILELVLGIGGLMLVCATCGLGYFLVIPMSFLARAVLYHAMLGVAGQA